MYYEVETKCGHVGRGRFVDIGFAVIANSKKLAAKIARNIPRVKHNHKDAIISVKEISYKEYLELSKKNNSDPYLSCKNIQEQKQILDFQDRIIEEENDNREHEMDNVVKHNKTIRHYKKFVKYSNWFEDYDEFDSELEYAI